MPKTNRDYWLAKVARNVARDARSTATLQAAGWRVEVIWECDLKDEAALTARLKGLLDQAAASPADAETSTAST